MRRMMTALMIAAAAIACGDEPQQAPLSPSPARGPDLSSSVNKAPTPASTLATGAISKAAGLATQTPAQDRDTTPAEGANWSEIPDDAIRQASPPHHSGVQFSVSPSRVVAGQQFTVTVRVPSGVRDTDGSGRYGTWTMEWFHGGYGQHVAKGDCNGTDNNWRTCEFTVPYASGLLWVSNPNEQTDTACWDGETYGRWTFPARCWDAKIVLRTTGDGGSAGRFWRNVLCVGIHHPTNSNAERRRITHSRCDQYIN